jgi:hypothetical protein
LGVFTSRTKEDPREKIRTEVNRKRLFKLGEKERVSEGEFSPSTRWRAR